MEESIILAVEIDTKKALTQIDLLAQSVDEAKKNQEELNKQFKEGKISIDEYNQGTKENTKAIKSAETATKGLTSAVKAEENSITALSQKNKELIKERNSINTQTVEGANKIREINKQIDDNNQKIKENVSGLEKQRLNIGNYSSALEGIGGSLKSVVPGLGGMSNGIMGITAGAKAFTATPFGATLQIIAGLLSVLIEAFKGSEEGQRNLNKVTQVTTALFGALGDLLRDLGGLLIDAFKNPKQALMDLADFVRDNLVNRFKAFGVILEGIINLDFKQVANGVLQFGSGVENVIGKIENVGKAVTDVANKALEQGNKVAKLQAEIEDLEDEANLRRAQNDVKVAKLREDAIKQEGDAKRKTIEEAIALEKQSADFSINIAQKKVELAQAELAIATNKKEATDNLEDAEVALAQAQAVRYQATLKFEKQLEALNDEARKKAELDAQYTEEAIEARQDAELAALSNQLDAENEAIQEAAYKNAVDQLEIDAQLKKDLDAQQKAFDFQAQQDREKEREKQKKDDLALANFKKQVLFDGLDLVKQIAGENSKIGKAAALTQIAYETGQAIAGLTKNSEVNPANSVTFGGAGALQFISGLIRIASNIAKAKSILESGGSASIGSSGSTGRSGVTATQATTNPINERFSLANTNQGMTVVASWKEATEVRNRVEFKESLITV